MFLTPLVLMQQIAVDWQLTEAAGPHTCELPSPEQQYGVPEVHRFWAIGFWQSCFLVGGGGFLFRLLSSIKELSRGLIEVLRDSASAEASARGMART